MAVVGMVVSASCAAYFLGRAHESSNSQVPQSPPAPFIEAYSINDLAQPSITPAHRRELIEEANRKKTKLSGDKLAGYEMRFKGEMIRVVPLNEKGFEFEYCDRTFGKEKVEIRIGLDSSVEIKSGKDRYDDPVLKQRALKQGDEVLGSLLRFQENMLYQDKPSYGRLDALLSK